MGNIINTISKNYYFSFTWGFYFSAGYFCLEKINNKSDEYSRKLKVCL